MATKEMEKNHIELCVQFKGEEDSTFFDVSIKNADKFEIYGLNKSFKLEKELKQSLSEAMKNKDLYELIILEDDYDEDGNDIVEEKTLVLNAESIAYFYL